MRVKFGSTAAALALVLSVAFPAGGAGAAGPELKGQIDKLVDKLQQTTPGEPPLKGELDGLLDKLATSTHGVLKWDGADRMDVRRDGDAEVADISNARITIALPQEKVAHIKFDHIAIRRTTAPDKSVTIAFVFPGEAVLQAEGGEETKFTLKDATANAQVGQSGRAREVSLAFAGARIDDKKTGDWIKSGPLSLSWKMIAGTDGGWSAPVDFALKGIEFFSAQGPVSGAVDRIAYTARSAGPDLAALNRLRDQIDALPQQGGSAPAARLDTLLDLLPTIPSLFSLAKGELTVDGLVARSPTGEPYVALAKASIATALTGLSGETAALRITLEDDGLTLAPAILDAGKVPHHAVLDFGLENVGTGPLHKILEAASQLRAGAGEADKQRATQQMIGAAAMLDPIVRIYDLAFDTPDVGVEASAEVKGSPLSPKGYTAGGDVAVRGFDKLPRLVGDVPLASYLPLLKEIGTTAAAADGTPRIKFHLGSAPPKWITVNGNDVSAWFLANGPAAGQPRALRPADPPMSGGDVRAVQAALAAAKIDAPQNGTYDAATAVAVARFQKANALNVDGVVEAATRQKLGVKPEPAAPAPAPPRPGGGPGNPPSR